MPQMSPLPWLMLMMLFITSLLIISFHMYHTPQTKTISMMSEHLKKSKSWLW